jgi:hypothetical protein
MQLRHGLVLIGCCLLASPAAAQDVENGWQFEASPYFWMAGMKVEMGVIEVAEPVGVDLSFGAILDFRTALPSF